MDIFIINLAKDVKRRDSITSQLQELNLPFELFPAVYGKSIPAAELARCYSDAGAQRIQCRSLTPSEIGCALSHIGVYREIVRRGIPSALILEDDVQVGKMSSEILKKLGEALKPEHPAVLLLSPADTKGRLKNLGGSSDLRLGQYAGGYFAHAYIVTQYGAQALLSTLFPVKDVADCWSRLSRHRIVDISVVFPSLVSQNRARFGSSTTQDIKAQLEGRRVGDIIIFKCRRAFWLAVDTASALYTRQVNPYAGVLKNRRPPA